MRYFTYIAEQSFKTAPTGERLFYRAGFRSRPYIVPDEATERRLYGKLVWQLRIVLGGLIIGMPFLFQLMPAFVHNPVYFLGLLAGVMAIQKLADWMFFHKDLSQLKRTERLPAKSYFGEMSCKHSTFKLVLGFLTSLLFAAGGFFMYQAGENVIISLVCLGLFGFFALLWGYALYLKLTNQNLKV